MLIATLDQFTVDEFTIWVRSCLIPSILPQPFSFTFLHWRCRMHWFCKAASSCCIDMFQILTLKDPRSHWLTTTISFCEMGVKANDTYIVSNIFSLPSPLATWLFAICLRWLSSWCQFPSRRWSKGERDSVNFKALPTRLMHKGRSLVSYWKLMMVVLKSLLFVDFLSPLFKLSFPGICIPSLHRLCTCNLMQTAFRPGIVTAIAHYMSCRIRSASQETCDEALIFSFSFL